MMMSHGTEFARGWLMAALLVAVACAGCGLKGDIYLPAEDPAPAGAPAGADEDRDEARDEVPDPGQGP
jgi:predicted small lipoprotein YifL